MIKFILGTIFSGLFILCIWAVFLGGWSTFGGLCGIVALHVVGSSIEG